MAADDWTEKYRPQTLKDIVGNPSNTEAMRQWAQSWDRGIPAQRALVLIGTPGIGKTSSAEALAREMGWGIVEMNASDQRTGAAIQDVALRASYFNTFDADGSFKSTRSRGRKLIVLDEADSLYGNADRGAMPAIVELIQNTQQPVILICNDFYALSKKSAVIKNDTIQVTFRKPQTRTIETVLKKICAKERIIIQEEAVSRIANNADGDLRAAIRDLQSLALGRREVTAEMADHISERESRSDMFQFLGALFGKRDAALAKYALKEADVPPDTALLWIDENLPRQVKNKRELAECYDVLSRADVYLGRVSKRMYYGFWSYANDLMVDGIVNCLKTPKSGFEPYKFPLYLSRMSRSKSNRLKRTELALKLGRMTHTSASSILNDSMPLFRMLSQTDLDFRVFLMREGGLDEEDLAYLMECKIEDKRIKAAMNVVDPPEEKPKKTRARKTAEKTKAETGVQPAAAPEPEKKTTPAPEPEKKNEPAPEPTKAEDKTGGPVAAPGPAKAEGPVPEPTKETGPAPEPTKTEGKTEPTAPAPKKTQAQETPAKPAAKTAKQKSLFDF